MGWERWREAEDHFSFGLVRSSIQACVDSGEVEDLPVEVTARLLFGALSAAATMIASAEDQKKTGAEVTATIIRMLERLRRPLAGQLSSTDRAPSQPNGPPTGAVRRSE